jgi:hypothetical protein
LPAALVAVLVVGLLEQLSGSELAWGGVFVYAAVMAPLGASIVVGARCWRHEHEELGLRAALLSALVAAAGTVMVLLT